MKGSDLIKALEEGKLLENDYALSEPEQYSIPNKCVQYIFHDKGYGFEIKGWGSALGSVTDRIMQILKNPEKWRISKYKVEDYPWNSNFNNK